ncbi:MAG: RDD family protein [Candidatus Hydrogenedentes bacterium]|nr:RDD family protein [Candidatus Hydrogenedentota bacterium]
MIMGQIASVLMIVSLDIANSLMMLALFVLNLTYSMAFEWLWRGQTLGKRVLGLRVMDVQGLRLHLSQVILRNLLRAVDLMPVLYLAGGLTLLLNRRNQRLGDIAANTVVVRARRLRQPDVEQIRPHKYNSFRAYPHLEARLRQRLTAGEVAAIIQALLRREELEAEARVRLYAQMVEHVKAAVTFPEAATLGLNDEQYLRNVIDSLFRKALTASEKRSAPANRIPRAWYAPPKTRS